MNQTMSWQNLLAEGIEAVRDQQGNAAKAVLQRALKLNRSDRDIRYWLANAHRLCGEVDQSHHLFSQLLNENPADSEAAFGAAYLLRENGQPELAAKLLANLAANMDDAPQLLLQISGFLRDINQFELALQVMDRAVERSPHIGDLYFKRARLQQALGRFDRAIRDLRKALDLDPQIGGAWLNLSQLQTFSDAAHPDWQRIDQTLPASLNREARMCLAFAKGKGLDDLGHWQEAWDSYRYGNQLQREVFAWSQPAWPEFVSNTLKSGLQESPTPVNSGRRPVYIIGMLRSGTTLLEQLLSQHPEVTARGETNWLAHLHKTREGQHQVSDQRRQQESELLWTQLRLDGPEHNVFIDKNPLNFRFVGLLAEVAPEARIIHVNRDGRESCLSCFFQLFQHPDAGFSYSLDDLVAYYRGYKQLMAHWRRLLGDRMIEINYDELVSEPENSVDRLLDTLGLDPTRRPDSTAPGTRPIRTASSWQARQPVHSRSIGRWRHYYEFAPEFFDALAAIDEKALI